MDSLLNKPAPDFDLPATSGKNITLSQFKGKNVVLYFYPKDCTAGCTFEGRDFRDHYAEFTALNTVILGVSRDDLKLHEKFKRDEKFPFELISDTQQTLCNAYQVIKEKNMFGKKSLGIQRSTFLIDKEGILRKEWRKVIVLGHVKKVLAAIKELA